MRNIKNFTLVLAVVIAGLFSFGCGSSSGGSDSDPDLIGSWLCDMGGTQIRFIFSEDTATLVEAYDYSFLSGGLVLDLDGFEYDRTAGSGETVVGTWDDGDGEIYTINSDNTFSYTLDGETETGTYTTSGGVITFTFAPIPYGANGSQIVMHHSFGDEVMNYTLNVDTLTLEGIIVFTRE